MSVPGKKWYAVAAALFLGGFVGMGLFIIPRLLALESELTQIVIPGEAELSLDKPGSYTIFLENPSVVNGEVFSVSIPASLRVSVNSMTTGEAIPLVSSSSANYSFGSRKGMSVFSFELKEPGRYRISGRYSDGRGEPRTVIAVSQGFMAHLFTTVFGSLAMAFGGAVLGGAVAIITWRRRKAARIEGRL